jgi:hypothetical protein
MNILVHTATISITDAVRFHTVQKFSNFGATKCKDILDIWRALQCCLHATKCTPPNNAYDMYKRLLVPYTTITIYVTAQGAMHKIV